MVVVTTGVGVEFLLPKLIGNCKKLCRVFTERSQECVGVILVPPLLPKEGLFVRTHAAFTPCSNQFSSVQYGYTIDIYLMSTRSYVFEDC